MNASISSPTESQPFSLGRSRPFLPTQARVLALWPALAATLLFLGLIGHQIIAIKAIEGGHFVYTIDDTYAHQAIARNLWQHGSWTFNAGNGFESGSSSLLWPVVIAASFAVFGIHEYLPLVLNLLAVVGLLFYVSEAVRRATGSSWLSLLILCAIVVLTPLPAVVSTGMEHALQTLLSLIFVDLAARLLMDGAETRTNARTPWWLCVTGLLLVLTRYEGLFLVASVGLLLLCRRRWRLAVALGVLTATPLCIFGLVAVSKGWAFLPNSLLLKGNTQVPTTVSGGFAYLRKGYDLMQSQPHMLILVAMASAALLGSLQRRWSLWTYPALVLSITLLTMVQHLQFASVGWFYRYEAYLVALVLFGVGIALGEEGPAVGVRYWLRPPALAHLAALALATLIFGAPLFTRAATSYKEIVQASHNIYDQQYQMARFVRQFYRDKGMVANDVGYISFFGDKIRLLDTVGLSNIDVLRARKQGRFDVAEVRRLSQKIDAEIAVIYPQWANQIYGGPLPEWVRVGRWIIPNNLVCGEDDVCFYATSNAQVPKLTAALRKFASELPKEVRQEGLYCGANSNNATGTYAVEGPKGGHYYWTNSTAQFSLYPTSEQKFNSDDTTVCLSIMTISPNQTIEVYFNGDLVATKVFSREESERWVTFPVKARWQAGANTVKLVGHGVLVQPRGDPRPLLFATLDPRLTMDVVGTKVPQSLVEQGSDD